jgi:hypothetical protein
MPFPEHAYNELRRVHESNARILSSLAAGDIARTAAAGIVQQITGDLEGSAIVMPDVEPARLLGPTQPVPLARPISVISGSRAPNCFFPPRRRRR